jgi:hypothetical protein
MYNYIAKKKIRRIFLYINSSEAPLLFYASNYVIMLRKLFQLSFIVEVKYIIGIIRIKQEKTNTSN